ncbi:MAG: hypothetical protein HN576_04015 [Bacteriovoracaceae bacterium]|jgi:hypothetical protein|nr:hypothetical protein [Bacteriovoracaceae bacterium]
MTDISNEFKIILSIIFMISFWLFYTSYLFFHFCKLIIIVQKKSVDTGKYNFLLEFIQELRKHASAKFFIDFILRSDAAISFLTNPERLNYISLEDVEKFKNIRKKIRLFIFCTLIMMIAIVFGRLELKEMNYLIK